MPDFTEGLLGIVIKSVGKENLHSSHIVLQATKMLSQESSLFFSASSTLNNFRTLKLKWHTYNMVILSSYDFVFNSSVIVNFKF